MTPIEIILIVLGIIIIIISCRLVDNSNTNTYVQAPFKLEDQFSEGEINKIKDRVNELLTEVSEEAVVKTDDCLSKISNEKIMAVNEFSDQIMEKINRNHQEVVFLYNMLNDKEKELKDTVKEIDSSKKKMKEILSDSKEVVEVNEKDKKFIPFTQKKSLTAQPTPRKALEGKQVQPQAEHRPISSSPEPFTNRMETNNNTQILSLYSKGKSIVEISKLLGLGQGEVKLVIGLFQEKKF